MLQGCSTAPPSALKDPRIRVTSPFKWDVSIVAISNRLNRGGLEEMQVEIFNKESKTRRGEYKVQWFDEAGFEIKSNMSIWKFCSVNGNSSYPISAVAPSQKAKDFILNIRTKHDGKIVATVDTRLSQ